MQVPIFHQKQENVAFKVEIEWGITQKISVPYITMDSFHSLTAPSRQNFQNVLSPDASGFPVQRPPPPLGLRIPKSRPWFGMDIFLNHPIYHAFPLPPSSYCLELLYHCSRKSSNKIEKSNQQALCFATQSTASLKK